MAGEERDERRQPPTDEIKILDGRAIWIDSPSECQILRRICLLPDAWNLLQQISRSDREIDGFTYLVDGKSSLALGDVAAAWDKVIYGNVSFSSESEPEQVNVDERLGALGGSNVLHLFAALGVLHDTWARDDRENGLTGLLMLSGESGSAEIEVNNGLVMHPGSLIAEMAWKSRYAATYVLALVTRRGRVESQIADDLIKRLRERATAIKLPTPSDVSVADVSGKRGVIVFLHGLMSTDAGLFDPLIVELKDDPTFEPNFLLLGFPHDSFSTLQTNAGELLDRLALLFPKDVQVPLAFVAHSRGGLLARTVAAGLYDADPHRWKTQIGGCVTFGTPHYGTPLAEYPSKLLGIGVTAIGAQAGGFASASDVLALVRAYGGNIPGISDLQSPKALGIGEKHYNFIAELREKERRFEGRDNCVLPILAVGGKGPHNNHIGWMTDKMFRGVDNDCAVELTSSAHPAISKCTSVEVHGDHFSYFQKKMAFEQAIGFIDQVFNHQHQMRVLAPVKFKHTVS